MTRLLSSINEIDKLTFEPIRAKVIKAAKAVNVDGTTVILGANGIIYASGIKARVCYPGETSASMRNALDGCIKLGILSKEAVAQHKANVKARYDKEDRAYSAKVVLDNANTLGIKLTKLQHAAITKAISLGKK